MFGHNKYGTTKYGASSGVIRVVINKHFSERDTGYRASYFLTNHDIAGPIKIVVTTPATGSYWLAVDISSYTPCHELIAEGVTLGAAGTALVFCNRNRQKADDCACVVEYGGTYTGGTTIMEMVEMSGEPGVHTLLKKSTSYQITVTTKADDNYTSVMVWVWQGSGKG